MNKFLKELEELLMKHDVHSITPLNMDAIIKIDNRGMIFKYQNIITKDHAESELDFIMDQISKLPTDQFEDFVNRITKNAIFALDQDSL